MNHTGVLASGDTDVTQYTWDADSRLVQVTELRDLSAVRATQIVVYLYDAEGRWIGENIENGAGVVTHETRFVYDGNQIVLQFDENRRRSEMTTRRPFPSLPLGTGGGPDVVRRTVVPSLFGRGSG